MDNILYNIVMPNALNRPSWSFIFRGLFFALGPLGTGPYVCSVWCQSQGQGCQLIKGV